VRPPVAPSLEGITNELRFTLAEAAARFPDGACQPLVGQGADSHPNLSIVLSRARVGILHRDLQRRVLVVNNRYCELVGRSAEELAGRPFEEFTHPEDLERSLAKYNDHLARAQSFEIEKRYVRPDCSVVWCLVHVSFVVDEHGRVSSTVSIAQDVSAHHQALQELRESEEHFRHTVELNPLITWTADANGAVEHASQRWLEVTGIELPGALGERWLEALHPDDVGATIRAWRHTVASGSFLDIEYRLKMADTSYRWFRSRAAPRFNDERRVLRWYGTLEDIHDRRLAEQALRESEERFRLAAEAAGLGIWDYDMLREQREWSRELRKMFGVPPDIEPSTEVALSLVHPDDRHLVQRLFAAALAGDSAFSFEATFRVLRADNGSERWMSTGGWRTFTEEGRLRRVLVTVRDVTEERTAEERILWIARHDSLTGLPNRARFGDLLDQALSKVESEKGRLALLLIDVDRLKETNDLVGHDAGDIVLKKFAARAVDAVAPKGVVARLGGDEFAILLPGAGEDDIREATARLMPMLRIPFTVQGYTLDCQATAGASLYPEHGTTAADLLKAADVALYFGKMGQRGALSIFEAEMRAGMQRRVSMLRVARTIVADDLVVPFYQPKVALCDRRVVGFEALLRWQHPRLGTQGPDSVAAAFDDIELATALSESMLGRVIRDMRRWLDEEREFGRIAFNLSPAEFSMGNLAERMLGALERAQIPSACFEVEVTETVLLGRDADKVGNALQAFRDAGITIALDDFGTGYASLTHLKTFPVDVIKIDRSFVSNLTAGSGDAAIVNAVIGLGRDLGMDVVAEGIETEAQAEYLRLQGCKHAQGYLFGRPMPAVTAAARCGLSSAQVTSESQRGDDVS
jgi:diguanylate cyclase (GGDEF)-like protein/PAS domain S-box-containing protein